MKPRQAKDTKDTVVKDKTLDKTITKLDQIESQRQTLGKEYNEFISAQAIKREDILKRLRFLLNEAEDLKNDILDFITEVSK